MESTDDRRHMFGLVAKESEKDLAELEEALRENDRKPCGGSYIGWLRSGSC